MTRKKNNGLLVLALLVIPYTRVFLIVGVILWILCIQIAHDLEPLLYHQPPITPGRYNGPPDHDKCRFYCDYRSGVWRLKDDTQPWPPGHLAYCNVIETLYRVKGKIKKCVNM